MESNSNTTTYTKTATDVPAEKLKNIQSLHKKLGAINIETSKQSNGDFYTVIATYKNKNTQKAT